MRHRAREAGTAIFSQNKFPPPFDISSIKAFPYEYEPAETEAPKSRELITKVLTESLKHNRLDSPARIALREQRQSGRIDDLLLQAEKAIRVQDWPGAMDLYRQATTIEPTNALLRLKLGLLCRDRGQWEEALTQFNTATDVSPDYSEAWRERGVVENKIAQNAKQSMDTDPAPGEVSLRRAVVLKPTNFDAHASLGGVLKRAKRFKQSLEAYETSQRVSSGHPYPLLNALKLRAQVNGKVALTGADRIALVRAERMRSTQAQHDPPFDKPWCFFDLAEIKLFQEDQQNFMKWAMKGFEHSDADWQGQTFVSSLKLLLPAKGELIGLEEGIAELEKLLPAQG